LLSYIDDSVATALQATTISAAAIPTHSVAIVASFSCRDIRDPVSAALVRFAVGAAAITVMVIAVIAHLVIGLVAVATTTWIDARILKEIADLPDLTAQARVFADDGCSILARAARYNHRGQSGDRNTKSQRSSAGTVFESIHGGPLVQ
jgi:hypothetical protein